MIALALVLVVTLGVWPLRRLRTLPEGDGGATPSVSIVVPARNEQASIEHALRSLAAQTRPAGEIIVVDDQSEDRTADIARSLGATVITPPPPPSGWQGKPWACHEGARSASGDLLAFIDADVTLAPDALERITAAHRSGPGGLLSIQPHHVTERWWEQLSALPNLVSVLATGALRRGGPTPAVAFGPCMVTSRDDYQRAGTHAAVAGEVIEDLALARAYERAGLAVRCAFGGSQVRFRMYPEGLHQVVEGWTKNLAGGPGYAPAFPLALAVVWLLALSSTVGTVATALVRSDLLVAGCAWAVGAATTTWMLARIGTFRWWAGLAFPVLWAAFVALFARSAIHRIGGTVSWRGRVVPVRG